MDVGRVENSEAGRGTENPRGQQLQSDGERPGFITPADSEAALAGDVILSARRNW
jgi:hypothetical protein